MQLLPQFASDVLLLPSKCRRVFRRVGLKRIAFRCNFAVLEIYKRAIFWVCKSAAKCREMLAVQETI